MGAAGFTVDRPHWRVHRAQLRRLLLVLLAGCAVGEAPTGTPSHGTPPKPLFDVEDPPPGTELDELRISLKSIA